MISTYSASQPLEETHTELLFQRQLSVGITSHIFPTLFYFHSSQYLTSSFSLCSRCVQLPSRKQRQTLETVFKRDAHFLKNKDTWPFALEAICPSYYFIYIVSNEKSTSETLHRMSYLNPTHPQLWTVVPD